MTWVFGLTTPFGEGILVSDVRVTFEDTKLDAKDILQKVHFIAPWWGIGFSGSVKISMSIVEALKDRYSGPVPHGQAYDLASVSADISRIAASIFSGSDSRERANGCGLLALGWTYQRQLGLPGRARVIVVRMVSPHFVPQIPKPSIFSQMQIGSGTKFAQLKRAVRVRCKAIESTIRISTQDMWQVALCVPIAQDIIDSQSRTVSPHLHILKIRHLEASLGNNNHTNFVGDTQVPFAMPTTVSSFSAFLAACAEHGTSPNAAVA